MKFSLAIAVTMILVASMVIQPTYANVSKVTRHMFAKGVDTSSAMWVPLNVTNMFTQNDEYVYAFTEASYSHANFTWVWRDPTGLVFWTDSNSYRCDGTCQLYDRMAISGTDAATRFGTWTMELFADGTPLYSDNFELFDFAAQYAGPFTPSEIRAAYDVYPLVQSGFTGRGVTVAIIGVKIGKTFYSDLEGFDREYGLPAANVSVVVPYGEGGSVSNDSLLEIAADAEWVHAMAPEANILLVLTGPHTVLDGFSYVIDHHAADLATMSFWSTYYDVNGDEQGQSADKVRLYNDEYARAVDEKITLIASSGDWGTNNTVPDGFYEGKISEFWTNYLPNSYLMPQFSPYTTIVGGSALTYQQGVYAGIGWNQSGGGPSNLFPQPSWQTGTGVPRNDRRNTPDIAFDASCETPYLDVWSGEQDTFCGTSMSAPIFAGIMTDIEQVYGGRLGFLNPTLYSLASSDPSVYHDIISGCSVVQPVGRPIVPGYCAHPGWDFVTGWGSIDAARLAAHFGFTPPRVISVSTSMSTSSITSTGTGASLPFAGIPGFPVIAIAVGLILGLTIATLHRRRRFLKNSR